MDMFLSDLSASVPEVAAIAEARDWLKALISVDPSNDKVMRIFMEALAGAKDIISNCNPTIFKNFSMLPSIISQEDMYNVFRSLSDDDRKVCWKYLSKLFRTGRTALMEMGEYDEEAECDMSLVASRSGSANTLQSMIKVGPQGVSDIKDLVISDGPIVIVAFKSLCNDLARNLTEGAPTDDRLSALRERVQRLSGESDDALMEEFQKYYSQETSQGLVTDTEGTLRAVGIPFLDGGADAAREILSSSTNAEAVVATCMQLGTLALTLQSVDSKTISAVEDVARNFVELCKSGDIDLSAMENDPFKMLEMISSSGLCDNLMEMLQAQEQTV